MILELINCVDQWFTGNVCPFLDTVFFDIVSTCGLSILQREESASALVAWTQLSASIQIGPEYELGICSNSDSPLRAEALARLFVIDRVIVRPESLGAIVSDNYQSIGDALMLLATHDQDICLAALETLDTIISKASPNAPAKPISLLMAHIHRLLLTASDPEVISKAQSVLAAALTTSPPRKDEFFTLLTDAHLLSTLSRLEDQCLTAPPSNAQSALHLLGFFLEHAHHALDSTQDQAFVLAAATRYIRLLRTTLQDANPFDARFAAAQSIRALRRLWSARSPAGTHSPLVLGLALALHDLLQDDDDEIRLLAAAACSTFLSTTRAHDGAEAGAEAEAEAEAEAPTAPLLATQHLLAHLATLFPSSPALATHALARLTAAASPTQPLSTPFAALLAEATTPQTALFAREVQNLYADPALAALSWTSLLSSPSLTSSLPAPLLARTAHWTAAALASLTARYEAEGDGALGFASRAGVFALLVRAVCLAGVVLASGVADGRTDVKLGLLKLVKAMGEGEGHGVVVQKAEGVLEAEVLRSLGVARGVAREAPGYAASWLG